MIHILKPDTIEASLPAGDTTCHRLARSLCRRFGSVKVDIVAREIRSVDAILPQPLARLHNPRPKEWEKLELRKAHMKALEQRL